MIAEKEKTEFLARLYREMYSLLFSYALSQFRSASLAEEAVQNAFLIAWTRIDRLRDSPNPRGWMMLTLKNVIRNTRRKRAFLRELVTDLSMESSLAPSGDGELDLFYGDLVSREDYLLLKRFALGKESVLTLSKELGISRDACWKRLRQTRDRLRQALEEIEKIL